MRLNTISRKQNNLTEMIGCNKFGDFAFSFFVLPAVADCQCIKRETRIIFITSNRRNSKTFCVFCLFYCCFFGPFLLAIFLSLFLNFSTLSLILRLWPKISWQCAEKSKIQFEKKNRNLKMLIMMQCIALIRESRLAKAFAKFTIIDNNLRFYCIFPNPLSRLPCFASVWLCGVPFLVYKLAMSIQMAQCHFGLNFIWSTACFIPAYYEMQTKWNE